MSPIKKLRLKLRMSIDSFAKMMNVTSMAIYYYESNRRIPRLEMAYKILDLAKKHSYPMTLDDIYPRPSTKSKD